MRRDGHWAGALDFLLAAMAGLAGALGMTADQFRQSAYDRVWPLVVPALLAATLSFSVWSVNQHLALGVSNQAQEIRMATLEQRMGVLERDARIVGELVAKLGIIDARQQLVLSDLARLRTDLDLLRGPRLRP